MRKPSCHVTIPLAQCDMGSKVFKDKTEWQRLWFTISEVHWEAHIEGLLECMREYVHPEAFKFQKVNSFGGFITAPMAGLIALLLLLL